MPIHHGADVLYQISLNTLGETGNIQTEQPSSIPSAVTNALNSELASDGKPEETLSSKIPYSTQVTSSSGTYSYYAGVSSLGRSAIYINNDPGEDPILLGVSTGVFPVG